MPTLSVRVNTQGPSGDGDQLKPANGLRHLGPRVQVTLTPHGHQVVAQVERGEPQPAPVVGWGLIDTGAQTTCFDQSAAEKAGLAIVDSGPMASATHDNETVPIYAGHIDISGTFGVNVLRAYGGNLASQGLIALIGRDVLQQGVLVFNGADGTYSFSI